MGHSTSKGFLSGNISNTLIGFTSLPRLDLDVHVVVIVGRAWQPRQSVSHGGSKPKIRIRSKLIVECLGQPTIRYSQTSTIEYPFEFIILIEAKAYMDSF